MKKNLISAFAACGIMLGATMSWGQNTAPTILKYPHKSQGYFIFNSNDYPNVITWEVEIQQLFINDGDSLWRTTERYRTPKSFFQLSSDLLEAKSRMKYFVKGYNTNGLVETETDWEYANGPAQYKYVGRFRCNGPTYSWQVSAFDKLNENGTPNGQGFFTFHTGDGWFNTQTMTYVSPLRAFHQSENINWLIQNEVNSIFDINSSRHYNYENWVYGPGPRQDNKGAQNAGAYFNMHNITTDDKIYDELGNPVYGSRWLVRKHLGRWIPNSDDSFDHIVSGDEAMYTLGSNPYISGGWISFLSQNIQFSSPLQCTHLATGSSTPTSPGSTSQDPSVDTWAIHLYMKEHNYLINGPVFETCEAIRNKFSEDDKYSHDNTIPWWPANEIKHLMVFPVCVDGLVNSEPIVQISKHLVVNQDGSINNYSFNLNPGLYALSFYIPEEGLVELLFEVDEATVQTYPMSNYLNANIFPNPVSSNQDIIVQTTTLFNIHYEYFLTDSNGNILERKTVRGRQGEEQRFVFDSNNLPNGQLFHKFVFSDGSEQIYHSLKM